MDYKDEKPTGVVPPGVMFPHHRAKSCLSRRTMLLRAKVVP